MIKMMKIPAEIHTAFVLVVMYITDCWMSFLVTSAYGMALDLVAVIFKPPVA